MEQNIDYKKLKDDLIDYFGTAMSFNPMAIIELTKVENASVQQLIQIALNNGFDLDDYVHKTKTL